MSRQRCTAWVRKLCAAGSGHGHRGPAQAESDTAALHEIIRLLSASSGMVEVECQQEAEAAHLSASSGVVEVECQQEAEAAHLCASSGLRPTGVSWFHVLSDVGRHHPQQK